MLEWNKTLFMEYNIVQMSAAASHDSTDQSGPIFNNADAYSCIRAMALVALTLRALVDCGLLAET